VRVSTYDAGAEVDTIAGKTVGDLIAEHRRATGITQRELAERSRLSLGAVRDIEQGRTARPRPDALRKLFQVVGLADEDLSHLLAARESSTPWRFRVLGPFMVTFNGAPVDVGSARQRAVLGLLALSPNAFVHRDAIADTLWTDQPTEAARRLVPASVSRLRRALTDASQQAKRELLVSDGPRYQLAVHPDEHDLLRFRRFVDQSAGVPADEAAAALDSALGLFDGDPLADLADLQNLPELTAIRIARTEAVLAYADVAPAQTTLPSLRAASTAEPLHTGVQAKYLIALAATGQSAAALRHFEVVRQHLADELAMEPDDVLLAAWQQILGRPSTAATVPTPAQLLADTADFTGRRLEIERLRTAMSIVSTAPVVCAITGTGGIGKTTLALHVAHQVRSMFPDGQLYLDLRGASSAPVLPGDALAELLRGLGVDGAPLPDTERAARYRSVLADRRVLVVLDNAHDPAQVRPLLPGSPSCAVLITSRHRMTVLPGARLFPLDPLPDSDAIQLLCRVAGVSVGSADAAGAGAVAGSAADCRWRCGSPGPRRSSGTAWTAWPPGSA
jgi:DNA-binding SARP family transcriptional activator